MGDRLSATGDRPGTVLGIVATVLVVLETTKVTVALPAISADLGASTLQAQVLTAGFLVVSAAVLVPAGQWGDLRGRRTALVTGLVVFALGGVLAGSAAGTDVLCAGRLVQGAGAGVVLPQGLALVTGVASSARAAALAAYGSALGLANVLGPLAGGLVITAGTSVGSWRALFLADVPVAAALAVAAVRFVPTRSACPREHGPAGRTDPGGAVVLGTCLVLTLVLPLLVPAAWPFPGLVVVFLDLVLLVLLVARHRSRRGRGACSVLDVEAVQFREFRRGLLLGSGWYAAVPATALLLSLFAQGELAASPLGAGLVVVPFAVGAAVGSWLVGRRHRAPGRAALCVAALTHLAGLVAGALAACLQDRSALLVLLCAATLLAGVGGGVVSTGNQVLTFAPVPVAAAGAAGGLQQVTQRVANSLGLAVVLPVAVSAGGSAHGLDARAFLAGTAVPASCLVLVAVLAVALPPVGHSSQPPLPHQEDES